MSAKVLDWWTGSNGNLFADDERGRYCIDVRGERMPMPGMRLHFLALDGKSIGGAGSVEQCKSMAARHAANGKL